MKTKEIEVDGEKKTLEERSCEGGCGVLFWVTKDSPQRRARSLCEVECRDQAVVIGTTRMNRQQEIMSRMNENYYLKKHVDVFGRFIDMLEQQHADAGRVLSTGEVAKALDVQKSTLTNARQWVMGKRDIFDDCAALAVRYEQFRLKTNIPREPGQKPGTFRPVQAKPALLNDGPRSPAVDAEFGVPHATWDQLVDPTEGGTIDMDTAYEAAKARRCEDCPTPIDCEFGCKADTAVCGGDAVQRRIEQLERDLASARVRSGKHQLENIELRRQVEVLEKQLAHQRETSITSEVSSGVVVERSGGEVYVLRGAPADIAATLKAMG